MNNKNFQIYFDFGSSKIRAAAISKNNTIANLYYESNFFLDYLNARTEIEKIISKIEKDTNEYLVDINLMIDNPKMKSISLSLSKNFDGSKLKKEDVKFLIQDAKQQVLSNHFNQNIIHIVIKNYKIDNRDFNFLPNDIMCNILSVDIVFICVPKKIINNLKSIFSKFDISINQIFCSSYAKSVSYKDNFKSIENISFIDIGLNKTAITHYDNNEIAFFHVIPIGGHHITKDLSKVLKINLIDAEEIKLKFDKNENDIIKKKLSLELIQKIIFARIEEILEFCERSIKLNRNTEQTDNFKMILMGEGSKILDNKFKEKISFSHEIDLLEETIYGICGSGLKLNKGLNKQEVVMVPKKQIKEGFFEKLFHFFR